MALAPFSYLGGGDQPFLSVSRNTVTFSTDPNNPSDNTVRVKSNQNIKIQYETYYTYNIQYIQDSCTLDPATGILNYDNFEREQSGKTDYFSVRITTADLQFEEIINFIPSPSQGDPIPSPPFWKWVMHTHTPERTDLTPYPSTLVLSPDPGTVYYAPLATSGDSSILEVVDTIYVYCDQPLDVTVERRSSTRMALSTDSLFPYDNYIQVRRKGNIEDTDDTSYTSNLFKGKLILSGSNEYREIELSGTDLQKNVANYHKDGNNNVPGESELMSSYFSTTGIPANLVYEHDPGHSVVSPPFTFSVAVDDVVAFFNDNTFTLYHGSAPTWNGSSWTNNNPSFTPEQMVLIDYNEKLGLNGIKRLENTTPLYDEGDYWIVKDNENLMFKIGQTFETNDTHHPITDTYTNSEPTKPKPLP